MKGLWQSMELALSFSIPGLMVLLLATYPNPTSNKGNVPHESSGSPAAFKKNNDAPFILSADRLWRQLLQFGDFYFQFLKKKEVAKNGVASPRQIKLV